MTNIFTDILAGFTFSNRILRLPAIILLNTTFFGRRPEFPGRNVMFNKMIAGRRRTLLLKDIHAERDRLGEQGDHLSSSGCAKKVKQKNPDKTEEDKSIEKLMNLSNSYEVISGLIV